MKVIETEITVFIEGGKEGGANLYVEDGIRGCGKTTRLKTILKKAGSAKYIHNGHEKQDWDFYSYVKELIDESKKNDYVLVDRFLYTLIQVGKLEQATSVIRGVINCLSKFYGSIVMRFTVNGSLNDCKVTRDLISVLETYSHEVIRRTTERVEPLYKSHL